MVNQIAVDPTVSIYKRMDKDKSKSYHGCGQHRIKGMLNFQFLTGFYQPIYQQFQVFPSRGDMIRYGCTIMSVMFTNEPFLLPKSHLGKPWIVYYDLLQSYQFCFCDRPLPSLPYGTSPPLCTILRRPFALSGIRSEEHTSELQSLM